MALKFLHRSFYFDFLDSFGLLLAHKDVTHRIACVVVENEGDGVLVHEAKGNECVTVAVVAKRDGFLEDDSAAGDSVADDFFRLLVVIFAVQLCGVSCALQGMLILEAVLIHCSVLFSRTSGFPQREWLLSDGIPDPSIPIDARSTHRYAPSGPGAGRR